jgi:pimeloyl-ACP methyl ester carboxylesterase
MDLPCENEILDFSFVPNQNIATSETAFWMMWMAMRSFTSEHATTAQEIRKTGFIKYQAFHDSVTGLQGFLAGNAKGMVLTFRGSTEITDWVIDAALPLIDGDILGLSGKVHAGFAYSLRSQWTHIEAAINRFGGYNKPLYIAGHSLGGALATLAAYKLAHEGYQVRGLYTFAAPRSGDREYADWGAGLLEGRHFRFINDRDLVPRYPPRAESIPWFEQILNLGLASRLQDWLALQLPYAHRGELIVFDHKRDAQALADTDIHDDVHTWSSMAQFVRWKGLTKYLLEIARNQKDLHNEKSYLCLLKSYRDHL